MVERCTENRSKRTKGNRNYYGDAIGHTTQNDMDGRKYVPETV